MKTIGKKLIEWGFLEYKPGMQVYIDNFGTDLYGVVEKVTSELKEDLGMIKTVHISLEDCIVREDYGSELLRPATVLEKIFKANKFLNINVDSHAYPF